MVGFKFPAEDEEQARTNMSYIAITCGIIRQNKIETPYKLVRIAVGAVLADCGKYLSLEEMKEINQQVSGLAEVIGEFI